MLTYTSADAQNRFGEVLDKAQRNRCCSRAGVARRPASSMPTTWLLGKAWLMPFGWGCVGKRQDLSLNLGGCSLVFGPVIGPGP